MSFSQHEWEAGILFVFSKKKKKKVNKLNKRKMSNHSGLFCCWWESANCVYTIAAMVTVGPASTENWNSLRDTHWKGHEWNINSPRLDRLFFCLPGFKGSAKDRSFSPVCSALIQMQMTPASFSRVFFWKSSFLSLRLCSSLSVSVCPVNSKELLVPLSQLTTSPFLTMMRKLRREDVLYVATLRSVMYSWLVILEFVSNT